MGNQLKFVDSSGHPLIEDEHNGMSKNFCWTVTENKILKNNNDPNFIYVKTDFLPRFVNEIIPTLTRPVVLITACSDFCPGTCFQEESYKILNEAKIIHWWAENNVFYHPKVSGFPVGLSTHDKKIEEILLKLRPIDYPKKLKIFCKWHTRGENICGEEYQNKEELQKWIMEYPEIFDLKESDKQDGYEAGYKEFYQEAKRYEFIVCPAGHGVDPAPMPWGALIARITPIIKVPDSVRNIYKDLPCVIVYNWKEILEPDFLKNKRKEFRDKINRDDYLHKLTTKYWADKVKNTKYEN